MRQDVTLEQEIEEVLSIMAEAEPEALFVLNEILTKNALGPQIILDMDDMNIRGKQIAVGVKDICHGSIKRFVQMIHNRSPWLVDELNKEIHTHRAVTDGGSMVPEQLR